MFVATDKQTQQDLVAATHWDGPGPNAPHIVLLHGWCGNASLWQPLLNILRPMAAITVLEYAGNATQADLAYTADVNELVEAMLAEAPDNALWLGWSLGGLLAWRAAQLQPQRVAGVITVATNMRFLADSGWPGMSANTFDAFAAQVSTNPERAVSRFATLQTTGADNARALARALMAFETRLDSRALQTQLTWLGSLDARPLLGHWPVPACAVFARKDALVPMTVANKFPQCQENKMACQVHLLDDGSHAIPIEQPERLASIVRDFCREHADCEQQADIRKIDIARSFSSAASSYDKVADLQRRVGHQLLTARPASANCVVDLGCGTGYFTEELRRAYPDATVYGLDLAEGMVNWARQHHESAADDWCVGDVEQLPFADSSVDFLFSSLVIQWCQHPQRLWDEVNRVLKPGGTMCCSTLGPGTLAELRGAWAAVDNGVHVNDFSDALSISRYAKSKLVLTFNRVDVVLQYDRVLDLLRELKSLGAHNIHRDRARGLTGRQRLAALFAAYEHQRNALGKLPATYDVFYLTLRKP